MAENNALYIEVFRKKNPDELSKCLADCSSRLEVGSGAAVTAALAAALLERAAGLAMKEASENERIRYIARNAEIVRSYMVHLIDEDVKCRGPLLRALKEGGEREIEASRQPAISICSEIVNMMSQVLALARELCAVCPKDAMQYLGECAELAMGAIRSVRLYIFDMSDRCSDDTYRFVIHRENEITLSQCTDTASEIIKYVEAAV